jgi:hypothetical protein
LTIRLFDLAKELGVDARALLQRFHTNDLFIASAATVLTGEQVTMARDWFPASAPDPFEVALSRAVRAARPAQSRQSIPRARRWYRGEIAPMTRLMLDRKVLPRRDDRDNGLPPRTGEVEYAATLATEWMADFWFTPKEVEAWMNSNPHIQPGVAADLQRNGLSPKDAARRVWYGQFQQDRPTLAERVGRGDITAKEAVEELGKVQGRLAS